MRFAVAAGLVLLALPVAHAGSDDPRVWIARMNEVLATRNYDGVFVHQVADRREVLRIIHRVRDGRMAERLVSTDGSGREFVRNGSEWVAYFPDRRIAIVEQRNRTDGFISALNGLSADTERFYEIRSVGRNRLQGAVTRLITVEPRDDLRYGYRFWIDEKTGMPLKTQLVSVQGEVIEDIAFVSLSLPATVDDELLKPDVDATGFQWRRSGVLAKQSPVKAAFVPRAELLPPGYQVKTFSSAVVGKPPEGPRTRFIISDGIAWVSVFIESADAELPQNGHGARRPDGVVQMGSSAAYTAHLEGYRITVVGEVPAATVKSIAEAMRPE